LSSRIQTLAASLRGEPLSAGEEDDEKGAETVERNAEGT